MPERKNSSAHAEHKANGTFHAPANYPMSKDVEMRTKPQTLASKASNAVRQAGISTRDALQATKEDYQENIGKK